MVTCKTCRTDNEYADPNQPDGSFICYGCKSLAALYEQPKPPVVKKVTTKHVAIDNMEFTLSIPNWTPADPYTVGSKHRFKDTAPGALAGEEITVTSVYAKDGFMLALKGSSGTGFSMKRAELQKYTEPVVAARTPKVGETWRVQNPLSKYHHGHGEVVQVSPFHAFLKFPGLANTLGFAWHELTFIQDAPTATRTPKVGETWRIKPGHAYAGIECEVLQIDRHGWVLLQDATPVKYTYQADALEFVKDAITLTNVPAAKRVPKVGEKWATSYGDVGTIGSIHGDAVYWEQGGMTYVMDIDSLSYVSG